MGDEAFRLNWIEGGTVTSPKGFLAGAVYAGLKTPGPDKKDVGVLLAEAPCSAAGVFTTNKVAAAPVLVCRERVRRGRARGIVFNAGNANAATLESSAASSALYRPHPEWFNHASESSPK